jgi:BirA family biotin operon repressor/biotin-[acetyl-CoA-carboxylase] ligase
VRVREIQHGVVDSTSERAFAALAAGEARHGDVHVARGQTSGRGRQGRTWHSRPGEGLYMSLVLLPEPPPYRAPALTIAAGLAVVEALCDLGLPPFGERSPWLDWPNDAMVGTAKIAGILTESRGLDLERPHYVLGLGLNVRQLHFPGELEAEREVTSLARLGLDRTAGEALEAVLERLGPRLELVRGEHRRLTEDYLAASRLADREVVVRVGDEVHGGRLVGLSLTDGLELRLPGGRRELLPIEFVRSVEVLPA